MVYGPMRTSRFVPRRLRFLLILAGALGCLMAASAAAQTPLDGRPPLNATERSVLQRMLQAPAGLDDGALIAAAERWARFQAGQRLRPSSVERFWSLEPPRRDIPREFDEARRTQGLEAWLRALPPADPRYAALVQAGQRYRKIAAAGGWTALPPGKAAPGERGPLVLALRQRLVAEGYDTGAGRELDLFDPGLTAALARFQRRHGLADDSALGPATRAALDVPAAARLEQIELNLERWRWLPRDLSADRIEVDIGDAQAVVFHAGRPALRMRVVVGAPATMTPMFASRLEAVVFNPPWNVPVSIAAKEITPKVARDPTYLLRHHYVLVPGGLQQLPGPDNALGEVKFDLPSPFGVYLHDTPVRSVFARPVRTLSHGCIRLERPLDLARDLLGAQGWTPDDVAAAVAAGTTRRVALDRSLPLFVVYRTAFVDEAGDLQFRRDAYRWDAKLAAALAATAAPATL